MSELQPGDRIECTTGRNSDCGNYYITNCRVVFGTLVKWEFITTHDGRQTRWGLIKFDDWPVRQSLHPDRFRPLNLLDRLAEI